MLPLLSAALLSLGGAVATPLSTAPMTGRSSNTMTLAPLLFAPPESAHNAINDSYIVILKAGSVVPDSILSAQNAHSNNPLNIQGVDGGIKHVYDSHIKGYSGSFSTAALEQLRAMPEVDYIEQDQTVFASQEVETQKSAPWGLARISHRKKLTLGTFNKYNYMRNGGEGVDVYVIDTGININHDEFQGRASWGKTMPEGDTDIDDNGHGTHCAGTIASSKYGVAKAANVIAVKVLGSNGSGSMSDVIGGVLWASEQAQKKMKDAQAEFQAKGKSSHKGSVANMSLGGGKSRALDDAVNVAVDAGLAFAVAAGNDNRDACSYSPAGAEKAVTVGASTVGDERAYFSNYGPCVDIFGPGLNILSTWIGSNEAYNTISGTSMASPHVAGLLAYLLSIYPSKSFDPEISNESAASNLALSPTLSHEQTALMTAIQDAKPAFLLNWMSVLPGGNYINSLIRRVTQSTPIEQSRPVPGSPGSISPSQLKQALIDLGTRDALSDLPAKTVNILIFNNATAS